MQGDSLSLARRVVAAFGGLTKAAKALGHNSVTTIDHWQISGRIPPWRRHEIREAAEREGIELPSDFDGGSAAA